MAQPAMPTRWCASITAPLDRLKKRREYTVSYTKYPSSTLPQKKWLSAEGAAKGNAG